MEQWASRGTIALFISPGLGTKVCKFRKKNEFNHYLDALFLFSIP